MYIFMGFPSGSVVKNPPVMQETQETQVPESDPLEEGMPTHSSILACRIPWIEGPGELQSMGLQRVGHAEQLTLMVSHVFDTHLRI